MNDEPIPLEDEIYEEEIEVEEETAVMMAMWGDITGDIDNQTDLKEALDAKQDNLTQAQLDAVNSGINSTKVATYDGYQAQINTKASQSALDAEAEARRQADSTLQGKIDAEETARKASDKDIQDVLDGETLARQNADTALGGRIDTEIHNRQVADIGLQGQIDAITSKSDVVDVVATYADLQAYDTQHLGDNDVIKVLDDETHGDALTYYRWSKTNHTWTFIGQEAPYYSKSQTDTLLLAKQNTIDSSHKLSADLVDDTSTTNKFVKASDIANWNAKQDALTPGTGINISGGVISTPAIVPEVVAELPTTGAEGKLYLTPKNYTTGTATGNPITISLDEDEGAIDSFQLDGDTFQQSYDGRNILPNTLQTQEINGVKFTRNADGSITIKGTASARTEPRIWKSSDGGSLVFASGTNYFNTTSTTIYYYANGFYTIQPNSASGVMPSDRNCDYAYIRVESGESIDTTIYPQIVEGSTAKDYEPFVGKQPSPSPEYPQLIQTVTGTQTISINGTDYPISLSTTRELDMSQATRLDAYINGSGVIVSSEGDALFSIPAEPNTTYTITKIASSRFRYVTTNTTPTVGASVGVTTNTDSATSATVTTGSNDTYIVCVYWSSNSTQTKDAIFNSAEITERKSIELCKLGDYQDYIYKDGDDWKVHKDTGYILMSGGETEVWEADTNGGYTRMNITLTNAKDYGSVRKATGYCDGFTSSTVNAIGIFFGSRNRFYFYPQAAITTLEQWKTWLASNNTKLYYGLATAIDTTITDTNLIAQLEAVRTASLQASNTITNTATGTNLAGDMELGYYEYNPHNRYNKWLWLDLNNNYEQIGGE